MYVPSRVFTVEGVGRHPDALASFELALRDAGVAPYNFVGVSSVYPPDAERVPRSEGVEALDEGQVVHAVLSRASTASTEKAAAAVGAARPSEGHGYFVEKSGVGDRAPEPGFSRNLAIDLLDDEPSEGFELYAEAEGDGEDFVTAVAAVVFVP